jgi:hypothetical protein
VTLKHIVQGASYSLTLEDRLAHFFRALDGLAQELGHTKATRPFTSLSAERWSRVRSALREARKQIRALAKEAALAGAEEEAQTLNRIADRVMASQHVNVGFNKLVERLLQHWHLHDATILEHHYARNPKADRQSWLEVLAVLRGTIMHHGFLAFDDDNDVDAEDVWVISKHLHDILIRIVMKMIGYTGTYQPAVFIEQVAMPVGWVTPDLSATELGYR